MAQGFFAITQTCPSCEGRGKIIQDPCSDCHGTGQNEQERNITVKVPSGVDEGTQLRFVGEGEGGLGGGPRGDLYVVLGMKTHPLFERQGQDVFCEVPISFPQATLGCHIDVPTLDGKVNLRCPLERSQARSFDCEARASRICERAKMVREAIKWSVCA